MLKMALFHMLTRQHPIFMQKYIYKLDFKSTLNYIYKIEYTGAQRSCPWN